MDPKALYREYLQDIKLMQLATSVNNQPWLCNVWFVADPASDKIFFISRETRRHSQEINQNERVACTFHKWFDEGLGQKGQALIISGKARQLKSEEISYPFDLYQKRYSKLAEFQPKEKFLDGSGASFFYEIAPEEIIWWDEANFPDQPRQKVL